MSTEGVDATEAAVVASMLASDKVPDENQSANCFSCEAPLKGLYCSECGQKNDNYRRSIFALLWDLLASIFSLESRIWRSWAALLLKPGKVAREFADGKRMYWSSPVRVYLAMSIILFGFMAITNTHLVSFDMDVRKKEGIEKPLEQLVRGDLESTLNVYFFETQAKINARNEKRDFDLIQHYLALGMENSQGEESGTNLETSVGSDDDGGLNLKIKGKQYGPDEGSRLITTFVRNPKVVTDSFNKWLPRLMFIMMPLTMFIGAIFIRDREKGMLFDHLVHAAYIHAVSFFLLLLGIILSRIFHPGVVFSFIVVVMTVYLPISLKRMFGRGWFKTILTTYSVAIIYAFVFSTTLLLLMVLETANTLSVTV